MVVRPSFGGCSVKRSSAGAPLRASTSSACSEPASSMERVSSDALSASPANAGASEEAVKATLTTSVWVA